MIDVLAGGRGRPAASYDEESLYEFVSCVLKVDVRMFSMKELIATVMIQGLEPTGWSRM